MEILGRGRQATVFDRGDGTAAKVFEPWVDRAGARREAELGDAVFQLGAPAPRIDRVEQVGDRWAIVFERLPGPSMMEEFLSSDDPSSIGAQLGRLLARIHECDGTGFEEVRDQWLRRTRLPQAPRIEARIRDESGSLPSGTSLLHTDLHPFNVMRNSDGRWIAIDWDGAARGDPAADLCRTLFLLTEADGPDGPTDPALNPIRTVAGTACEAAYCERAGHLAPKRIDRWRPLMLAARIGEDIEHERARLLAMLRDSADRPQVTRPWAVRIARS